MAGTIEHSWNGTVLTIKSDSGTSSMDLKGATGDDGRRGPQGPAGEGTINSVNGKIGDVQLTANDVGAASKTHTHTADDVGAMPDTYVAPVTTVNNKTGEINLTYSDVGAAPTEHTHDDRYYTETEINTKLSGKSDTSHTHNASDITAGTLAEDRLPVVPATKGGSGETTIKSSYSVLVGRGNAAGNLNSIKDAGVYWANLAENSNGPATSGYGTLEVLRSAKNSGAIMQRFTFYQTGYTYVRTYVNSQWYSWFKIGG